MTAEQVLRKAAEKLRAAQIENASFDASCLVESITGLSRAKIMLCDDDISDGQAELIELAVLRRISGEPLQYILGEWDFFGRTFEVGEGVLVPRPETELIVELALEKLGNARYPVVFDLCKHDNLFVKILSAPGLWMQRITTAEPDDSMIEVGIAAINAVIPHNDEEKVNIDKVEETENISEEPGKEEG